MKTKQNFKILSAISIVLFLAISAYFFKAMTENTRMETNLDEYMPKDHPDFKYSDQAEEWFQIKDGIIIAIEHQESIYNPESLRKIKELSKALQDMDAFDDNEVKSLYTSDNIVGSAEGMEVESFYKRVPKTDEELTLLRHKVRDNEMVQGRLVSESETIALIIAGINDGAFSEDLYNEILTLAESYQSDQERIYVAGRPIVEGTLGLLGPEDMKRMVPLVIAVILLVLYWMLRSIRATAATLLTVFLSTVWAFGLMAATGIPIYSVSTMIPVMLIAIGVAYGIYFFNHLKQFLMANPEADLLAGLSYTLRKLWKPLTMAAFTTIIGFISLLSSEVYPIKYFGIFTAFGIAVSYLLALLFLPAITILWGYRIKNRPNRKVASSPSSQNVQALTEGILRRKKLIYVLTGAIILFSIWGIQKVWINSSFLDKFEKDSDIVQTDAFINQHFGGTSTLNLVLESETNDAFKQPEVLELIDKLQSEAVAIPEVGSSFGLTDYLKRMNKVMNSEMEAYYTIPESVEMVAQYLLLYEMSGDPENLTKVVNYDYNRTNFTFQLKGDDSKTIHAALAIVESYRPAFEAHGVALNFAGSGYKALVFTDLILEGQLLSIAISLGLVFLLLSIMFRSIKAGLIGSLPIILTAIISFGVMGLLNIPLSTTTALLSSIAIGIGVDYAIHFLQNYRNYLDESSNASEALQRTMQTTGNAIWNNALVVIAGFLVLLFSVFPPNRMLGALVSMNMFTSFLGTLSLMMVVIHASRLFQKNKSK